jgi:hypothetical protein
MVEFKIHPDGKKYTRHHWSGVPSNICNELEEAQSTQPIGEIINGNQNKRDSDSSEPVAGTSSQIKKANRAKRRNLGESANPSRGTEISNVDILLQSNMSDDFLRKVKIAKY